MNEKKKLEIYSVIKKKDIYTDIIKDILLKRGFSKEEVEAVRMDLSLNVIGFGAYIYVAHIDEYNIPVAIHIADEYMPLHNLRKAVDREIKINNIFEN